MNSTALFDMIAARAAAQDNTAVVEMLTRMRNSSETDPQPSTQDLVAKLGQDNPMLGMLAQHIAAQKPPVREPPAVIDVEAVEIEACADADAGDEARMLELRRTAETAELRARIQSLSHELSTLRDREDILAEALGACCLCWGEDSQCRACRGRGRPGYAMPDEELFEELVLPAVQMLRARRIKQVVIAPMTPVMTFAPGASGALRHT